MADAGCFAADFGNAEISCRAGFLGTPDSLLHACCRWLALSCLEVEACDDTVGFPASATDLCARFLCLFEQPS